MTSQTATRMTMGMILSLILLCAGTPAPAQSMRATGGERAEPAAHHDAAIAALEPLGTESGWGRAVVRDDDVPSGLHRTVLIQLHGLEPRTDYLVEIDGLQIGSIRTKPSGSGVLKLQNRGGGHDPVPEELPGADTLEEVTVLDPSLAAVLEGSFTHVSHGGGEKTCEQEIPLVDVTGGEAAGVAHVEEHDDGHQELETCATGLVAEASYSVVVDSIEVAVVTADDEGQACVHLESPDEDNPIPPELLPVCEIAMVEWFDEAGELLLSGTFSGDDESCTELQGTVVEVTENGFTLDTGDEIVTVVTTTDTEWDDFGDHELAAGDSLKVEGCWDAEVLVADEVELLDGDDEQDCTEISGTVVEVTEDGFTLDTGEEIVTVATTTDTEWDDFSDHELAAGDSLKVEGCWDADVLVADEVELLDGDDEGEDAGDEESCRKYRGTVGEVTSDGFVLDTNPDPIDVAVTSETEWSDFGDRDLAAGDLVKVDGCWDGDVFVADEVELVDPAEDD